MELDSLLPTRLWPLDTAVSGQLSCFCPFPEPVGAVYLSTVSENILVKMIYLSSKAVLCLNYC